MASEHNHGDTVSRRDFFKTAGVTSVATSILTSAQAEAQGTGPQVFGPGEVPIRLTVNGQVRDLQVEPRTTLLDAVRDRLTLTGNKRVCDRGACGACTMIVDGRTIYSCSTLAIDVQGKTIRTVDGLANGDTLHPVQRAFCETDGMMCGFCTPGFVVATVALLEKHPHATPEQTVRELNGNVCRCGTFNRVYEAARMAVGGGQAAGPGAPGDLAEAVVKSEVTRG
jgi:xanthine dehydrogenase YagT iron-sulfur-binding subunit